jgi:hypothetical protein
MGEGESQQDDQTQGRSRAVKNPDAEGSHRR